ncbi:hypothetical protein Tco_1006756 [Tanacetum coccineum]|uniref:Uncharacterized protein n=1 Tax=Tanacetum coccineum TaxID=301880 RepID=A0ABQ5FIS9_9ASTR
MIVGPAGANPIVIRHGDVEDDGGGVMVMVALLLWLSDGEGRRRVEESEVSGKTEKLSGMSFHIELL